MKLIKLSKSERAVLRQRARSRIGPTPEVRRARLILLIASGKSVDQIRRDLSCSNAFIARWSTRFADRRLAGLFGSHSGQHSSETRRRAGRTCDAPNLTKQAADVIGLYVHSIQHAVVFCIGDTAALRMDRLSSVLIGAPAERRFQGHSRPGVVSLYTAFLAPTTEAPRHPDVGQVVTDFGSFLTSIIAQQPRGAEIHVVADQLSTTNTVQLQHLTAMHCTVHLHLAPSYASWIAEVKRWFGQIERGANMGGGVFPVQSLTRALLRHIRRRSEFGRMTWKYVDPHRAADRLATTVH